MTRVGLLVCDHVGTRYRPISGDYEEMFAGLFEAAESEVALVPYDACHGVLPSAPDECDGWVCTGSRAAVYEEHEWIAELSEFVRSVRDAAVPFVGVCFGHQLLAQALGGRTAKAPSGWGVGAYPLEVARPEAWMDPDLAAPNLLFVHQDQVQDVPPDGVVLASAPHCPVAMFRVGDSMLGIQPHPEFSAGFVDAILADRTELIGDAEAAAARASLSQPTDEAVVARWLARFLGVP